MIVVIDTSVWVSAMNFDRRQSAPVLALEKARNRDTIAICDEIEEEITRILSEKFKWDVAEVRYRLTFLLSKSMRVVTNGSLLVCRDPNDDMVLECALLSGAQAIVAGDKDLLVLEPFRGIRIVTPTDYLALSR